MEVTVTAKTYDEAITEALIELQTTSEYLDVQVLEEGKEGLLGVIGSKPWVIRAKALSEEELAEKNRKKEEPKQEPKKELKQEPKKVVKKQVKEAPKEEIKEEISSVPVMEVKAAQVITNTVIVDEPEPEIREAEDAQPAVSEKKELKPVSEEEAEELIAKAKAFLKDVFVLMTMEVLMDASFDHEENELDIILSGDDMGVLIGKRGQTLDSLQYLTSLVVNRKHDGYIRVKLDTENYRERRQVKLEELAHNIAKKVAKGKKAVELEPMNPYERRIIHSALQSDPLVTTISEGEEPYRHVVVMLKKSGKKQKNK